jgi:hypothetical protein
MRSINNVRWLVKIDKEMGAESKERTLIRTVEYLIGEHLEGLVHIAVAAGDTFEYELKINQLDDTKTHWNYEIKLDRAHIWEGIK